MTVTKIIRTAEPTELEITGATLLSIEEYRKHRISISSLNNLWWLRSQGYFGGCAAPVFIGGPLCDDDEYICKDSIAVHPALKIKNLISSNLWIGDKFNVNGYTFTVISKDYAICDSPIKKHKFDKTENNYEESEIKKYIDEWFEDNFND